MHFTYAHFSGGRFLAFSAAAREGVWFVLMVVKTHICVFAANEVMKNFAAFNTSLLFERPDGVSLTMAKYDVENFFPNIPRELVRRRSWIC